MATLTFFVLALLLLATAAATVWLRNPLHAAYALIAALVAGAGMVAWLHAEFLALALLLGLAGGVALLLMTGLPLLGRVAPLQASRPDEDRSFWAGLIAVLFFVITYRVLATTTWGLEDRSQIALSEAQRGLEAIRSLGETLVNEHALALIGGILLVGVAVAVAAALNQPEVDA